MDILLANTHVVLAVYVLGFVVWEVSLFWLVFSTHLKHMSQRIIPK